MTVASSGDELLIVVPVEPLRAAKLGQGFDPSPEPILAAALQPGVARVMPRALAERDPRFKQIVAYVILRHRGRIFHYRRSSAVGERRLAGLRSLGVGGHLNQGDVQDSLDLASLRRAIHRELGEELVLAEQPAIHWFGMINDDSTEVGKVHVGLVAVADLRGSDARLRDPTLVDGRFDLVPRIVAQADDFESWSRLCLPALLSPPAAS
ncbi:MAG: phosphoesterase [Chloroflexota bacterium]